MDIYFHSQAKKLKQNLQKCKGNLIFDNDTQTYCIPLKQKRKITYYLYLTLDNFQGLQIIDFEKQLFALAPFAYILNYNILDHDFRKGDEITHDEKKLFYNKLFHLCQTLISAGEQDATLYEVAYHICEWIRIPDDQSFLTARVLPLLSISSLQQFTKCVILPLLYVLLLLPQINFWNRSHDNAPVLRNHNHLLIFLAFGLNNLSKKFRLSVPQAHQKLMTSLLCVLALAIGKLKNSGTYFPDPNTLQSLPFYQDFLDYFLFTVTWCSDVSMSYGVPFCILSSSVIMEAWHRQILSGELQENKDFALQILANETTQDYAWLKGYIFAVSNIQSHSLSKQVLLNIIFFHAYSHDLDLADTLSFLWAAVEPYTYTNQPLANFVRSHALQWPFPKSANQIYVNVQRDYKNLSAHYPVLNTSLLKEISQNHATLAVLSHKLHWLNHASTWNNPPQVFHVQPQFMFYSQKWDRTITRFFNQFLTALYPDAKHMQLPTVTVLYLESPANESKMVLLMKHVQQYPLLIQTFLSNRDEWHAYWPTTCSIPNPVSSPVHTAWQILFSSLCTQHPHQAEDFFSMAYRYLTLHDISADPDYPQFASLLVYLYTLEPAKFEQWLQLFHQAQTQTWRNLAAPIQQLSDPENITAEYNNLLESIPSHNIIELAFLNYTEFLAHQITNRPDADAYLTRKNLDANVFLLQQTLKFLPDFLNPQVHKYSDPGLWNAELMVGGGSSVLMQSAFLLLEKKSEAIDPHNYFLVSEQLLELNRKHLPVLVPSVSRYFYKYHIFYLIMNSENMDSEDKTRILKSLYKNNKTLFLGLFVQFLADFDYHAMESPLGILCTFMQNVETHREDLFNVHCFLKKFVYEVPTADDWNPRQRTATKIINKFFPFF